MFTTLFFGLVALISNSVLFGSLLRLVYFLSSQTLRENELDINDGNIEDNVTLDKQCTHWITSLCVQTPYAGTLTLFTIDVCLVVIFMAQHSGLASPTYRYKMEAWGLQAVSRAVYILMTGLALQLLMSLWQPITEVQFWTIDTQESPLLWLFFHVLHWVLWIVLFLQVLVMEPLYLVGIKQVYYYIQEWNTPSFYFSPRLRQLLRHMPHPGSGCFIAVLWIHPYMTFDRMILATVLTAYLLCGYSVTEKDYEYVTGYSQYVETRETTTRKRVKKTH